MTSFHKASQFSFQKKENPFFKMYFYSRGSGSITHGAQIEGRRIKQINFGGDVLFGGRELHEEQENKLGTESEFGLAQVSEVAFTKSSEGGFSQSSEVGFARSGESEFADWKTSDFGACSRSCGGGIQTRHVFCKQVG